MVLKQHCKMKYQEHIAVVFISRWDRYLGMTAAMTQVPVPRAMYEIVAQ